ncbi:DUF1080 domain-containing protein [Marinilabilia rubra]|uniref:Glycosyl hydrolase n=1 Tax=Marinilabilia rubra TaxID=2162893 RepID=A0A2U2BAA0_9BACT|nr:family 16 glycoside hydrolase [Marinilabilia rubra]PWD99994.1 glycosyl hydrolase [Marinilabilia rubra]
MKYAGYLLSLFFLVSSCQIKSPKGEWQVIFNGESLEGWTAGEVNNGSFSIENGLLKCTGPETYLYYDSNIRNFEFEASVKTENLSKSALFFHAKPGDKGRPVEGYKIQINNNFPGTFSVDEDLMTGSIRNVRNIYYPFVDNDQWFKIRLKVVENRIQVFINDVKVNDYTEQENPWRWEGGKFVRTGKGAFVIQSSGSENSAYYKSIRVKELPDSDRFLPEVSEDWDTKVTRLMSAGFPLVDYHVHLKGGLTLDDVIGNSGQLGINYGIAPNCGLHFPITNDSSLYAYLENVNDAPAFKGMQAEGREWVKLFSSEAIRQFDYVFTDAMTFTDEKGRRNRIWIPEEVWVDDKQAFMEQMVQKIEAIFSREPVDIYVNPTVLPDELTDEYDRLWTEERKQRVINVLAENGVALEINARYELPKAEMIKKAKKAGVKFTFGTNNTGRELGHLDYCLEMIEKCDLKPEDMFHIKPDSLKPIVVKGLPEKITG